MEDFNIYSEINLFRNTVNTIPSTPTYREMLQKLTTFHGKLITTNPAQPVNYPLNSPAGLWSTYPIC